MNSDTNSTKQNNPSMECGCRHCHLERSGDVVVAHMVLCPDCGNKRCPKANNHLNGCTSSNDTGQPGSAYS